MAGKKVPVSNGPCSTVCVFISPSDHFISSRRRECPLGQIISPTNHLTRAYCLFETRKEIINKRRLANALNLEEWTQLGFSIVMETLKRCWDNGEESRNSEKIQSWMKRIREPQFWVLLLRWIINYEARVFLIHSLLGNLELVWYRMLRSHFRRILKNLMIFGFRYIDKMAVTFANIF